VRIKDKIIQLFEESPGIHSLKDLTKVGAYRNLVRNLVHENVLEEVTHGFYKLAGYEPEMRFDYVEIAAIIPKGIFCLTSSLSFHNLGTQMPDQYHIAIPSNTAATTRKEYPIKSYFYSDAAYKTGIEEYGPIKVYSIAKTVADCFKFRNKIGLDVALEALKCSIKEKRATIPKILEMAEVCRVKKIIMPYLEAYTS
jgi:predicted transcriptional regulator of viral defense system